MENRNWLLAGALAAVLALGACLGACQGTGSRGAGDDDDTAGDTDTDTDGDADGDSDSDCEDGELFCIGNDVYECEGGEEQFVESCDPLICLGGICVSTGIPETCEQAAAGNTTVGCLFFGVDLDLVSAYDLDQFALFVSNVQVEESASVLVEVKEGSGWNVVAGPVTVGPMELQVFEVPDRHVDWSGTYSGGAYRITSDVPIVAYQINPYEADESYTSDASMLYPVPAWDSVHYVLAQELLNSAQAAYATVIAAVDDTVVEITPTVNTRSGTGVPAGSPGVPFSITLDEGDVGQFAVSNPGDSLTGTLVTSDADHPIAVFTGNTCINVPIDSAACDHLQEQLAGVQRWGTEFVAGRMPVRSTLEPIEDSLWQIVASEDDTTIEFTASSLVTGLPTGAVTLDAGEAWEAYVGGVPADPGDFYIGADKPIAVANYMTGSSTVNPHVEPTLGDPSVVQIAPVEQFLNRYVMLVPEHWMWDVATVVRPAGATVTLDDVAIEESEWLPVGSAHEVARVEVADGVHTFEGTEGFAVVIAGYDDDDSYAYLGGSGTLLINPIPE